ncbi:MAG: FtsB family cell division protein [Clostridium sp.]
MKKKINFKSLIILVLLIGFAYTFVRQEKAISRINAEIAQREKELQELKIKNERLQDQVNISDSDEYLEALARDRLKMIKPGEKIVNDK